MKKIAILGSTGHVGRKVLEVVSEHKNEFKITGLSANENYRLLLSQAKEFGVEKLALRNENLKNQIREEGFKIYYGPFAWRNLIDESLDVVIIAITGIDAVYPLLYALQKGINVALASKEALIAGGELINCQFRDSKSKIIPLDSEHNAIFQIIQNLDRSEISAIYLTCSGGPFLEYSRSQLEMVTPEMAVSHPRWKMGKKISVDSATLLNKGFEIIEAYYLFQLHPEKIKVLIHPQAIVHGMVELNDGNIFAHMAVTDMKVPIAYALGYPLRLDSGLKLNWQKPLNLEFFIPDSDKFPALRIAYFCLENRKSYPAYLAKLDDILVDEFLQGRIKCPSILEIIEEAIKTHTPREVKTLDDLYQIFAEAEHTVNTLLPEVSK